MKVHSASVKRFGLFVLAKGIKDVSMSKLLTKAYMEQNSSSLLWLSLWQHKGLQNENKKLQFFKSRNKEFSRILTISDDL